MSSTPLKPPPMGLNVQLLDKTWPAAIVLFGFILPALAVVFLVTG